MGRSCCIRKTCGEGNGRWLMPLADMRHPLNTLNTAPRRRFPRADACWKWRRCAKEGRGPAFIRASGKARALPRDRSA